MDGSGLPFVTSETTTPGGDDYLVPGLAVGIPCGLIILILMVLIVVMICITWCNSREQENLEATYMRRRFQGLSLEEQRRRQRTVRGKNKFTSRRSSATLESRRPSTIKLTPKARIIRANPFGLQDWQLKLSGIDAAAAAASVNGDTTEETDLDSDSPRSPVGAMNPLMLQQSKEEDRTVSYKPVHKPPRTHHQGQAAKPIHHTHKPHPSTTHQAQKRKEEEVEENGSSSDSFNPYDD